MIRIEKSLVTALPPQTVWAVLSDYPNVYRWAPMVRASAQASPNATGHGAARTCEVPGFGSLTETISQWDEGRGFSFDWAATGPIKGGQSRWEVHADGQGSRISVQVDADTRYGLLGTLMGHTVLRFMMGRILADALRGLDHYARTGEAVDQHVAKRLGLKAA
jgi:carbon monoxide dehydrogenase subunit G